MASGVGSAMSSQPRPPGSLTTPAPMCSPCCQTPKTASAGSAAWAGRTARCPIRTQSGGSPPPSSATGTTRRRAPGAGTDYTTFTGAEPYPLGGIGGVVPGSPPHWLAYFAVADTDAAVAATERAGGTVVRAATDSPYSRSAVLADATRAVFAIIQTTGEGQPDRSGWPSP